MTTELSGSLPVVATPAQIYNNCEDVPQQSFITRPNLLRNGDMSQGQGVGASSVAGPGWTTSYTVPSGGNLFSGAGAGASTWMFYDASNMASVFNGGANPQLLPIGGGKAFGVNVGPNMAIPIIAWANIYLENDKRYRISADAGVVNFPYDVALQIDGVVITPLTAPAAVNTWTHTEDDFTFAGVTGFHTVSLNSNNTNPSGNDHAFDNFALTEISEEQTEDLTAVVYTQAVRAVIDQIVQSYGCNDNRRDQILSSMLQLLAGVAAGTGQATSTVGVITRTVAAAAGNTAVSAWSVTFTNVGTTNATVGGQPLVPGQTVTFNGYFDEVSRQMVRLPAIAYVGSATAILHIATVS